MTKIRNAFIFLPPVASYKLIRVEPTQDLAGPDSQCGSSPVAEYRIRYTIEELARTPGYVEAARLSRIYSTATSRGETIYLAHVPPYTAAVPERLRAAKPPDKRPVLIHCHGNATDLGLMMLAYIDIATMLNVDVVGVEYTGFGASTGKPHFRDVPCDMKAAFDFVVNELQVDPLNIILYGQSVGSAPVMSLAATQRVAGVVLHSPMLSGIRVLDPELHRMCRPSQVFCCFDVFPNYKLVTRAKSDLLIIHGQQDDVIPFAHGQMLADRFKARRELSPAPKRAQALTFFPKRSGHNDIMESERDGYYKTLIRFLRTIYADREDGEPRWVQVDMGPLDCLRDEPSSDDSSSVQESPPAQQQMDTPLPEEAEDARAAVHAPGIATAGPTDGKYSKIRAGEGIS